MHSFCIRMNKDSDQTEQADLNLRCAHMSERYVFSCCHSVVLLGQVDHYPNILSGISTERFTHEGSLSP